MMSLTQAIVAKTLFDADVSDEADAIAPRVNVVMEYFGARLASLLQLLPGWVPTPANLRMRRAVRQLDAVVYRMIAARRRSARTAATCCRSSCTRRTPTTAAG